MRTFHLNGGIPQNNLLVSVSGDATGYLNAIALYTNAVYLVVNEGWNPYFYVCFQNFLVY